MSIFWLIDIIYNYFLIVITSSILLDIVRYVKKVFMDRVKGYSLDKKMRNTNEGSDDTPGVFLLTICLLNALRCHNQWQISVQKQKAKRKHDIVELFDGSVVLIQSKHKDNSEDLLLLHNFVKFNLLKYFLRHKEIKRKYKVKNVIISSNETVDRDILNNILIPHSVGRGSMVYYEGCSFFVSKNIGSYIYNIIKLEENVDKTINKAVLTEENFLKGLQFHFIPHRKYSDHVIEKLLSRLNLKSKMSPQEIYGKIEEWLEQPDVEYLTEVRARAMFSEIISDKYWQSLKNYNISFKCNVFNFADLKRIYQVTIENEHLMQMLKICHALQGYQGKKLFVNPEDDISGQKRIIQAFELPDYTYLILIWSRICESVKREIGNKLRGILEKYPRKKAILVTKANNDLIQEIGLTDIAQFDGCVKFEDLSNDSQKILLNSKNVDFQDKSVSIKQILDTQTAEYCSKSLNSKMLEKIIRGEQIKVGKRLSDLDENVAAYYIPRTFEKDIDEVQKDIFQEDNIVTVNEKVILVEGCAGIGKSTLLTKLTATIKSKNPYLWVIKINLNNYKRKLKDLRTNTEKISLIELLDSQKSTKFTNSFERFVFSMNGKVVLMLDGIEEINPDCTHLIIDLISQCQQAPNFKKIFVTARPRLSKEISVILKVRPFKVLPLSKQTQIHFLTYYWHHNFQLNGDTNKNRCQQYATALMNKMSWENAFSATPLHVRLLAEIFEKNIKRKKSLDWEGCKEYLNGNEKEPRLPENFDITTLYDEYIEKKLDIFVIAESCIANEAFTDLFDMCLDYHRSLALEIILDEKESDLLSNCHRDDKDIEILVLKMGIVQRSDDRFQFTHISFAEYFVADILKNKLLQNQTVDSYWSLMYKILSHSQFVVIRKFLDGFLQRVYFLPFDILGQFLNTSTKHSLSYCLEKEGFPRLSQIVMQSIYLKSTKDKVCFHKGLVRNATLLRHEQQRVIRIGSSSPFRVNTNTAEEGKFEISRTVDIEKGGKRTALHLAVMYHELDAVKSIALTEVNLNVTDKEGRTPLHLASQNGALDIVKFLGKRNVSANIRDNSGRTPLHLAAEEGQIEIIEYLVQTNIDINARDHGGRTPLHLAVKCDKLDTVKCLVEHKADFDAEDNEGYTPLHIAVVCDELDTVKFLVQSGAAFNIRDNEDRTPIHLAMEYDQLDIVKFLKECEDFKVTKDYTTTKIKYGAVTSTERTVNVKEENVEFDSLHSAALQGQFEIIKSLMACGIDLNTKSNDGRTVLHSAASQGLLDVVQFLVHHHADVNLRDDEGNMALHLADDNDHLDIVKYLVDNGADINIRDSHGNTVLHCAAECDRVNTVEYLVDEANADVNIKGNGDRTPLHFAVRWGNLDIVKFLLKHQSINVNITDNAGRTPLHYAAPRHSFTIVKLLLENKGNVNFRDKDGCTALHLAARGGNFFSVEYLAANGADINITDNYGRTVLHLLAEEGEVDVVKSLVERKADITIRDMDGFTALDLAEAKSHMDVVEYLSTKCQQN